MEKKIHSPKHVLSVNGKGLPNTLKVVKPLSSTSMLLEETWQDMEKPWNQGEIITAKPGYKWISKWEEGKNYVIDKVIDEKGNLVAIYCDICAPVKKIAEGYEFEDWYLDVWQPVNQKPQLLDEDELEAALKSGYLTQEQVSIARKTAEYLLNYLEKNSIDF